MRRKIGMLTLLLTFIGVLTTIDVYAEVLQKRNVSGVVVSAEDNLPLAGVSVVVKNTTQGTISDMDGKFEINVSAADILQFSFIGYQTREISADSKEIIRVVLSSDTEVLDEVVVVGYGTMKKVNLTGSVSSLDMKDLASRPITQTSQALQGKIPGVTITQNFGIPGSDAGTVRIRGIGTLGESDPLVLIDGVEGSMNDINPSDIENISVLKDAASSAIYGSRAANGVVLITTKRGRSGERMSVSYNGLFGFQLPTDLPEVVDGATYMMLKNENERNNGRSDLYTDTYIQEYIANVGEEPYFDTDWFDSAMKKSAFQNQHNVTISGGSEKMQALVSLSNLNQKALIDNAGFVRRTLRFNTDFKATNKLSFTVDGSLYTHKQEAPSRGENHIFEMMAEIPNIYPARWEDGSIGEGWNGDNPLGYIYDGGGQTRENSRIVLNIKAKYDITDWLSAEFRYSPKYINSEQKKMVKQYTYKTLDGSEGIRPSGRNSLSNSYNKTMENFYQALLRFNKTFKEHAVSATLGYEALDNTYKYFSAFRENYLLPDYEVISGGDGNYKDNDGGASEYALLSYLGRINYSYKDKYLLEANLRYDGSSRFAEENRWGVFPSFSAGWRISEESFMQNVKYLSNLKIRASWGRLGNQNIGNYSYQGLMSVNLPARTVPYYFGKVVANGAAQTILPNRGITWETTEDLNFGVDFGFFNNRLTGSFDYYKRNTHDILYTRDIPAILGLDPSEQNIAEVQNKGWDLQLGWQDQIGDFGYNVNFVLSDVRNKVIDLDGLPQYGRNVIFEEEEYMAYYGYECIGIYRSEEDLKKYPALNSNVNIGDLIFKDQNNDGVIDEINDKKIIGSSIPRFNYGLNISLDYKGFDFSVFFQGVGKKDLYYNVYNARYGGNYYTYQLNRLIPDDPSTWQTADWPRINDGGSGSAVNQTNSFHLYNAAYLRCKNLVLGYTIPEAIVSKAKLAGARIYLTGQNLFTLDKLKINSLDPESPDVDQYGTSYYPNIKTFAFGVELKF